MDRKNNRTPRKLNDLSQKLGKIIENKLKIKKKEEWVKLIVQNDPPISELQLDFPVDYLSSDEYIIDLFLVF